ncbi:MAG: hypothetical protein BMS9Abin28_0557 [Anaerolineae bacterium]|nr:MAG: hypothetical protein BMS9Abin28_0557 [Anaerolineae bacterium]
MEEALLLISSLQGWIYLLLLLTGLVYLRLALKWQGEVRSSQFGLERERAGSKRSRAAGMLVLILATAAATFVVSTFLAPQLPASPKPTAIPTISLLEPEAIRGSTSVPQRAPNGAGCLNESATITSPTSGEEVRSLVEVLGSADIPNFAFYKIEIRPSQPNSVWQVITAGTEILSEDVLGTWDTSLVENGVYLLQLVVTDTAGNAPLPCTIEIVVLPEAG